MQSPTMTAIRSHARGRVSTVLAVVFTIWIGAVVWAQVPASPAPAAKAAAGHQAAPPRPRPGSGTPASAAPAPSPQQVEAGRVRFAAQCGFCHGRDAAGGETGPDLTRSPLVAEDVRGEKIGAVVRSGRPDKGMPPMSLTEAELAGVVAFLHDARTKAKSQNGGRRSVSPTDLKTGDAAAGERYFNGAGGCVTCHQVSGPFATVATRYQGLPLLQRMLYPGSSRNAGPQPSPAQATVTTASGQTIAGRLAYRDEFVITLTDADGWSRSWPLDQVKVAVTDPMQAHADQLAKYTDDDIHNVLAYLQTLR
jgi:cytochrome c oxidase cbb3-type subunit 3